QKEAARSATPLRTTGRTPLVAVPTGEQRAAAPQAAPAEGAASTATPLPELPRRRQPAPLPEERSGGHAGYWLAALLALALVWMGWSYRGAVAAAEQSERQRLAAIGALEWAVNLGAEYPYGEPPFGGERLPRL